MVDAVYTGGAGAVFMGVFAGEDGTRVAAGHDGDGNPVTVDTAFEAASVAKMIVATAILQLVDEGLIDLDAPVAEYVDIDVDPGIAVRDVMRHHSGIENLNAQLNSCPAISTLDSMKAAGESAQGPLDEASYSNTNYLLLGYMVGQVSGVDVGEYTMHHIFSPVGMTSTYWWETQTGPHIFSNHPESDPTPVSPLSCPMIEITVGTEGLTFVTSLADMDAFFDALFGGQLIRTETLQEMLPTADDNAGLGIWSETNDTLGLTIYGHFGSRNDLEAVAYHHPQTQRSVVVATIGVGQDHAEQLMWRAWEATSP